MRTCVENGAGEVVVNSIDTDGVKKGFDLKLLKEVTKIVSVPVIASGGAGKIQDFHHLIRKDTAGRCRPGRFDLSFR